MDCLLRIADVPQYGVNDTAEVTTVYRHYRYIDVNSSSTDDVIIPTTRLVTVGDRAFAVAGSRLWNSLPPDIISAQTLPVFCNRLKPICFPIVFPHDCTHTFPLISYSVLVVPVDFGHFKY